MIIAPQKKKVMIVDNHVKRNDYHLQKQGDENWQSCMVMRERERERALLDDNWQSCMVMITDNHVCRNDYHLEVKRKWWYFKKKSDDNW